MMWRSALRRWLLRIGNLVVLHAANPSDYHDTGPVITSKFHTLKISVPIIRRIVTMRFILFQMYVNYFTKQECFSQAPLFLFLTKAAQISTC